MKILLTGFEPFAGANINPSWELVSEFDNYKIGNGILLSYQLPVSYARTSSCLIALLKKEKPDIFIGFGQAINRASISLEMVGLNMRESKTPDNDGQVISGQAIDENGPVAYFANLQSPKFVEELHKNNIPALISFHGGTFLCNEVLYTALNFQAKKGYPKNIGFIHLPLLPEQTVNQPEKPSMSKELLRKALMIIIGTL